MKFFFIKFAYKLIIILKKINHYIHTNNIISLLHSIGEGNKFDYNVTVHKPEKLKIGNNNFFGQNTYLIANGGIEIGNYCAIAADCKFITRSKEYHNKLIPVNKQPNKYQSIKISDNCWFGYNVIVLPGVTLGKGCIIAANAVVTKSFPEYSVIGGVPAKLIKRRS